MAVNLFGPPSDDDIRVGYIDPVKGYVSGVTRCEANEYAKKEPGTVFVFKSGRKVLKYLNINEVNKLTLQDVAVEDECGGISYKKVCGPPEINIFGGGGVGAVGNPVIGIDGSILAVDLVSGGHGYQYAPEVTAIDNCEYGNGAVLTAVLGEIAETVETFENEEDFEEYELCDPDEIEYGKVWGSGGEDLGVWDPTKYTKVGQDPIQKDIEDYTKIIRELARKPFWTTRKFRPDKITSSDSKIKQSVKHDVTFPAWNDFMNQYAISPVPPSNVKGTDFAGILFTMEWDNEFPVTGEYVFRGLCDNRATLYFDNLKIADLGGFADPVNSITKTVQKGRHKIRIDLLNEPIYEVVATSPSSALVDVSFNVYGDGRNTNLMTFSFVSEDGTHSFSLDGNKKSGDNRTVSVKVKPNTVYKVIASSKRGKVEQGIIQSGKKNKEGGLGTSNKVFADHIASDNDNDDIQITAIGGGVFTSSNKRGSSKDGTGRSTFDLTFQLALSAASSNNLKLNQGSSSSTIQNKKVFNTIDYIDKADRTLWRTNTYGRGGFLGEYGICPFDTSVEQLKNNPYAGTHRIVWKNVNFPIDGDYNIRMEVDDNVTLRIGNQFTIRKEGFFPGTDTGTGELNQKRFIKAGNYDIVADLEQIPGGKFGFGSIKGTNPMALAIDIQASYIEQTIVSGKSWNENPMGVSLSIDAPEPEIPQEPAPIQEGRCPPNPIWSTRSPRSKERWYPVKFYGSKSPQGKKEPWAPFFNRYAISPVPPLDTPGTDAGGTVFTNSWEVDIPYDGFYKFQAQRDDTARIYLDGNLVFDIKTAGDDVWKNFRNKVKSQKAFISKGRHTISVEIENSKSNSLVSVNKKIFSTSDWSSQTTTTTIPANVKPKFVEKNGGIYLEVSGEGQAQVDIVMDVNDSPFIAGLAAKKVVIPSDGGDLIFERTGTSSKDIIFAGAVPSEENIKKSGKFTAGKSYGPIQIIGASVGSGLPKVSNNKIGLLDADGTDENIKIIISDVKNADKNINSGGLSSGTAKDGVTYEGPLLASYATGTLGPFITPAFKDDDDYRANNMDKTWLLRWRSVDFPEDGRYTLKVEADDRVIVRVDGEEVGRAKVFDGVKTFIFSATKGKRTVELELYNIPGNARSTFKTNPVVASVEITKDVKLVSNTGLSWDENPIGIGAALVAPPCPKIIRGKGVVNDIKVFEPGNGYLPPAPTGQQYPVSLRLKEVIVENSGINYRCGLDQIQITPSNGAVLEYICDPFGKIKQVKVVNPGLGFNQYPEITIPSDTGVNARFRPQFEVVRDPIVSPQKLIQVTDLVGLKQTGFVDGRPYYGAVFYKEGIRYAGFYETPGELVQVYDTLQESITGRVTTRPSAIQRQGTDVTSNDPRLDIPNTPDNLI